MTQLQAKSLTDPWVTATWDDYIQAIENLTCEKAKCYYYHGQLRIEMSPLGHDHASDHVIIIVAISIFSALNNLPIKVLDNVTYRQAGVREAQPDVSFYIGENADIVPWGTSIIDLNIYPPPGLVIEVANTSLADDKGEKRLLYEELKVKEYWIVDVKKSQIIALAIANKGSRRIQDSQVLHGLDISLLESALQQSRQMNQSQVVAWLLTQFQK